MTSRTEPKTASEAARTWSYGYTPLTGYKISETSPLDTSKTWVYNNRGNLVSRRTSAVTRRPTAIPSWTACPMDTST